MEKKTQNKMGTMPIFKLLVNMAVPMMLSMLVQAMYNIVDSIFVSRISEAALTAVSLAFPAQNLMIGTATGLAVGVNALLSRALGAGEHDRANKISSNGVFLAMCGFVLYLVLGLLFSRVFIAAQTGVTEIIDYGTQYLLIVTGFSIGIFGQCMYERLMQSTGRTVLSMISQMLGAVINIVLDPVFIFVLDLGVRGAAIATVIGQIVAFIFGIWINEKKNVEIKVSFRHFRPDGGIIKGILSIAIPSMLMVGIGSIMTFAMNIILISMTVAKETAATVFGVYFKLNSFTFMPIFGLNNAVIPIVAYNYGANNRKRMMATIKTGIGFAAVLMAIGTLLFMLIPDKLLLLFDASETMLAIGVPALRIIASTFMVAAVCISLGSSFQALGYGTYSMITSFARQLVVLIPSAYLLAKMGLETGNANLVWYSFPIAEVMSLIVTALLFGKLYRKIICKVPEGSNIL